MKDSDEEYYSEGADSDGPDSEMEALLYSKIHYAQDVVVDSDASDQSDEVIAIPQDCPDTSAEKLKLATCSDDEEIVILEEINSSPSATSDSSSDNEQDPDDPVVISSNEDDDVIVFGDSDLDIEINAEGVQSSSTAGPSHKHGDLWHIDPEDKYRHIQGFRYHSKPNFQCKSCGKFGHLSKNCPKPKEKVCYMCAQPGHRGTRCPSRMCSRCYATGHLDFECHQPYVEHCKICNLMGHPSRLCPDFWRRYHLTTKAGPIITPMPRTTPIHEACCFNCAGTGHYGHRCPYRRRGYVSTPFIVSYAIPRWDESINEGCGPPPKRRKAEERADKKNKTSMQNGRLGGKKGKRRKASEGPRNGEGSQAAPAISRKKQRQQWKEEAAVRRRLKRKEKRMAAKERRAGGANRNENGKSKRTAPTVVHLQSAR